MIFPGFRPIDISSLSLSLPLSSLSLPSLRMLCEWEVRALHAVADTLLLDFDPSEALIFLESKGVISEDYVKLIESRVSTAD